MNAKPEIQNPKSANQSEACRRRRKEAGLRILAPIRLFTSARTAPVRGYAVASQTSGLASLLLALAACACFTGCSLLKPAHDTAQHFVLTPLPAPGPAKVAPTALGVGVGQVKVPAYLFDTSLAVRKGTNQIDYLPLALWAERLDTGIQRVLAANLATLLPTDQIRLSAWRSETVAAEVYVTIEQFDVDSSGRGVLVAWWRILSPGGETTLKAGESRLARPGPAPDSSPSGAIATLSDLMAEHSRQLAQAITEATRVRPPAPVSK